MNTRASFRVRQGTRLEKGDGRELYFSNWASDMLLTRNLGTCSDGSGMLQILYSQSSGNQKRGDKEQRRRHRAVGVGEEQQQGGTEEKVGRGGSLCGHQALPRLAKGTERNL